MSLTAFAPARSIATGSPHVKCAPDRILKAFNTWAFKREQPSSPEHLTATVATAIARNAPVSFVLYWGRGPRTWVGTPDLACLDFVGQIRSRIAATYTPGAKVTLILTDTHAALNGYRASETLDYFREVEQAADERGFSSCLLGDVVARSGLCYDAPGANLDDAMLEKLQVSAAKWYRGEGGATAGAARYYCMNMIERRAVEIVFPDAIFITFNNSEFRDLFPELLPIFYMYSTRKGVSVKPWFEADRPLDAQSARPGLVANANEPATANARRA